MNASRTSEEQVTFEAINGDGEGLVHEVLGPQERHVSPLASEGGLVHARHRALRCRRIIFAQFLRQRTQQFNESIVDGVPMAGEWLPETRLEEGEMEWNVFFLQKWRIQNVRRL